MKTTRVLLILLTITTSAFAQSDLELIAFPQRNSADTVLRSEISPIQTVDDRDSDTDFEMIESIRTMRYSLKHTRKQDIYFNLDTYWASTDGEAKFDDSKDSLPRDLYDVGVGGLIRQKLENGNTFGATLRVGSASDKLFDSTDEVYLRTMLVLRVPTKQDKNKSWVYMAILHSDADFPVLPGIAYAFPFGKRSIALIGFPMLAVGGQLSDKVSYFATYYPAVNIDAKLNYRVNDKWTAYTGLLAQARYFSRADRDDDDDKIRLQDTRVFLGSSVKISKKWRLDTKAGYLFAREFGEGNEYEDRRDNTIRLDNAVFASGTLQFRF